MDSIAGFISIAVWAIVILSLIRFIKKVKKNPDKYIKGVPNPQNKPIQPPKPQQRVYGQPGPLPPSERPLKRCTNCGGEIPVEMMRCEICGKRMIGCGSIGGWAAIAGIIGVLVAMLNDNGMSIMDFLKQFVK